MRSSRATSSAVRSRFAREQTPALVVDQAELASRRRQAQIGIVLAQQQAIFGAAREHAIRLARAARDQVVDEHADVGLVAARPPRRRAPARAARR